MNLTYNFIDSVNDASINTLINFVRSQTETIEHLQLNISSLGGSVTSAITAYNFLKSVPFAVTTHNLGEVTSAAVLVYLAGTVRTAEENSKFLIHPIKVSPNGNLSYFQLQELIQLLDADIENYASIVNKETDSLNNVYNVKDYLKSQSIALNHHSAIACGIITQKVRY